MFLGCFKEEDPDASEMECWVLVVKTHATLAKLEKEGGFR